METYNEKIATDDSVELVLMSQDSDAKEALGWAKKEDFPWPTVSHSVNAAFIGNGGLFDFKIKYVPTYYLISKDGKVLAEGKDKVFELANIN